MSNEVCEALNGNQIKVIAIIAMTIDHSTWGFFPGFMHIWFEDIVSFHAEFEQIHPFQDGNGRVGRLIVLKECLRFNIVPFIIEDSKKGFYYRGLYNWNSVPDYLISTCPDGQDTYV